MNYDGLDRPTLSDFALFALIVAWKCAPVLLVIGCVVVGAVMMGGA